ncbi:MAG: single-stranded DNA-binding protein [Anaerolineales bacterium]|nr:single-stranded DNA-binding protein [Anaerolineales bacterium]
MPALNRIQLIGNLGKDPELRTLPSGNKVCSFSMAVNHRWKNGAGEPKEETEWFAVESWGKLGEICHQYLSKGKLVYVEGRMRTDHWQDDKGEPHSRPKVVGLAMQILDRKPEEPDVAAVPGEEAEG